MCATPFKDRTLAGIRRDIIPDLIPGQPGNGLGAGGVDWIFKMEARIYYLLDPAHGIGGYQQRFAGGPFQVDIVHQCEPAESELAHNCIEQGFELIERRRLPAFGFECGDIAQAASIFETAHIGNDSHFGCSFVQSLFGEAIEKQDRLPPAPNSPQEEHRSSFVRFGGAMTKGRS